MELSFGWDRVAACRCCKIKITHWSNAITSTEQRPNSAAFQRQRSQMNKVFTALKFNNIQSIWSISRVLSGSPQIPLVPVPVTCVNVTWSLLPAWEVSPCTRSLWTLTGHSVESLPDLWSRTDCVTHYINTMSWFLNVHLRCCDL